MATNVNAQICVRRDTAANWTSANPTLLNGEIGYDTTNNKIKVGNGSSTWTALSYLTDATGGGGGGTDITDYGTVAYWATDFFGKGPMQVPALDNHEQNYGWWVSNTSFGYVDAVGMSFPEHPGVIGMNITGTNQYLGLGMDLAISGTVTNTNLVSINAEAACVVARVLPLQPFVLNAGLIYDSSQMQYGSGGSYYGYYFRATNGVNGNKWECVYRVNNTSLNTPVEYTIDSGVAIPGDVIGTGAWANLKVTYTQGTIGAPEPTVRWYINGTLVATKDMNTLPANRAVWPGGGAYSTATYGTAVVVGSGADNLGVALVDYMHFIGTVSRTSDPGSISSVEE